MAGLWNARLDEFMISLLVTLGIVGAGDPEGDGSGFADRETGRVRQAVCSAHGPVHRRDLLRRWVGWIDQHFV